MGSEDKIGEQFVDGLEEQFGDFPGERAIHAKGIGLRGEFTGNGTAASVTRAEHLAAGTVPALARFSNGDGDPNASDGGAFSRGFAVRFKLPGQGPVDLLSIVSPTFITSKPEIFLAFIRALRPDPSTHRMSGLKLAEFALRHMHTMEHVIRQQRGPVPRSFATTPWHAVHAFGLENASGQLSHGRFSWQPVVAVETVDRDSAAKLDPSYLMADARARVESGAIEFDLQLTIAGDGDALDQPDVEWPDTRQSLTVGRLRLSALADLEATCFSPANLCPGVSAPNDEIFPARLAAYAVSQARRKE